MSSSFGKPLQIQEKDCDVEPITEADFVEDGIEEIDQNLFGRFTRQHILYNLNMVRLHKVGALGVEMLANLPVVQICLAHSPSRITDAFPEAKRLLLMWSQNLEPEMQYETNPHPDFWVRILQLFARYVLEPRC